MNSMGMKAEDIAYYNNILVLKMLLKEPLSSFELEGRTGLTHMATGRILRRLYEMGIVKPYNADQFPKKRSVGRPLFKYEINPERAYFVCINFHHAGEEFYVCDLKGNVIHTETLDIGVVDNAVFGRIIERIKTVLSQKNVPLNQISIVSLSIPGRINDESGEIIVSSKIDKSVNLFKELKNAFPSSTIEIKNDIVYSCINSILTDEFDYGKGTHLYIYVGEGVACCLIYDKKIISGSKGFGGEIGMNRVDGSGTRLSDAISISDMVDFCKGVTADKDFSLSSLKEASEKYPEIKDRLNNIAETLGKNICNYVDTLGSTHIVFAGPITNYPDFFFDKFLETLKDTNYSGGIDYKIDFSFSEEIVVGQMLLSRLNSLDWIMQQ